MENKEKRIEYRKKYYQEHKEERRKYEREHKEERKKYRYKNITREKETRRKSRLKNYGINLIQYNELLIKQNNLCGICLNPEIINQSLSVDHCHITNKIRGLLCNKCNLLLGFSNDNVDRLKQAIKYLEK